MKLLKVLLSFFPSAIPVGKTKFDLWLKDIVNLAGPIADEQSIEWVVCNEVMRLSPGRDRIAKRTVVKILRKFAANQLAAARVMEIKLAQEERAKKLAEATAQPQVASNDTPEKTT